MVSGVGFSPSRPRSPAPPVEPSTISVVGCSPGTSGSFDTCREWVCPESTSGQVPESGPAEAGSCTSAMSTLRGDFSIVAASCSPAPITWSATRR